MRIKELRLVPDKGGCFEVVVGGELLYSKLATGAFPEEDKLVDEVGTRLGRGA